MKPRASPAIATGVASVGLSLGAVACFVLFSPAMLVPALFAFSFAVKALRKAATFQARFVAALALTTAIPLVALANLVLWNLVRGYR